jgi:hypothetical protein
MSSPGTTAIPVRPDVRTHQVFGRFELVGVRAGDQLDVPVVEGSHRVVGAGGNHGSNDSALM